MSAPGLRYFGFALLVSSLALPLAGQEPALPPADRAPVLVLAHPGPHAPVTALAFSPDGASLYVGGFDKQVRRYDLAKGAFAAAAPFRVPTGPGNAGVVNALAVSPDGKWVAAAGRAPIRRESWAGADDGVVVDVRHLPPLLRRDIGVVYLFDPAKPDGGKVLRGQQSEVRALAFADPAPAGGPVLVTAGIEWNDAGEPFGAVRVFDVAAGKEIAARADLPPSTIPPGVAACATGADKKGLRVAVNWATGRAEAGRLLVWDDPGTPGAKSEWPAEGAFNFPLAVRVKDGAATELITGGFHLESREAQLTVRPTGGEPKAVPLAAPNGQLLLPVAVAALTVKGVGDATAVLARVRAGAGVERHELRLLGPGAAPPPLPLADVAAGTPVLAASPDGRFVAVAGFTDNRVEVYDAAQLAAGKPVPQLLAGDAVGFRKVAFLAGEKLWLGAATDTPEKGGVVLDLDRNVRAVIPAKDGPKVDAPAGAAEPRILDPDAAKKLPGRVVVAVGGAERTVSLAEGEIATAAALLPAKPAWDAGFGPVLAVAQVHARSRAVLVKLFDPITGKLLLDLGGPTLPVRSLAFSGTRPLLAAAGDDGTVAVWSLKGVTRKPAVEGLLVTDRGGAVVVASVQPDSPAAGKIKADDVIESVADAKGVQKAVKAPLDFVLAIRALKVGENAQIKLKGQAAPVAVAVGTATGFRHPLFTLWVDPVAAAGRREWVGWTAGGPYDASGEAGEARIGWLTATGDPAQPVTFSGANQYRKLFYKRDFLRLLLETADYPAALARIPPPIRPTLTAVFTRDAEAAGPEKITGLEVSLNDPDAVLDLARAELWWRATGPGGAAGWAREPFAGGRVVLDLGKHDWKRGEHRVHVKLFTAPGAGPEGLAEYELTAGTEFRPPPPTLVVTLDGKAAAPGAEISTENEAVAVGATADAKGNPDGAAVTLGRTGGKPVELRRNKDGTFVPEKVALEPGEATVLLVRATNRGEGVKPEVESSAAEVRVRRLAPKAVPPPSVRLLVLTPFDFRTATDEPYVVSAQKVTVTAHVADDRPLAVFEWKVGAADWEAGTPDAGGPAGKSTQTRELALPIDGKPLVVRVRAKSKDGAFATDAATLRYDGLPDVSVTLPPAVVTTPELKLGGGLKVTSRRPFRVRVLVTSARTGRTREFDPTPDPALTTWEAGVTLFPGENRLGYVVSYDDGRKELRRAGLAEVRYLRPPVVAGAAPIDVGTGAAGDLRLAVLAPLDAPPTELRVNGIAVGFRAPAKPVVLAGVGLWTLEARSVPVNPGADRLKPVALAVSNADRESEPVACEVVGRVEVKVPPPEIRLAHAGNLIAPDRPLAPVGDPNFTFELKVNSDQRLTRVELWQRTAAGMEQVGGVSAGDAVAVPGGFEVVARPTLKLRPGVGNDVKVVASNAGGTASAAYAVTFTPPPVWVVIDAVREPGKEPVAVAPGAPLVVTGPVIDVEGRVSWFHDDEPIGQDRNLSVVFTANGVVHLPVAVPPGREVRDGREIRSRKFAGRVYLNTPDRTPGAPGAVRVRADLRSGNRPLSIPQAGLALAGFTVTSQNPLRRQRLHVLALGVEVPEARRKELVQNLVKSIGGTIPADNPNFTEGRFERKDFEFAYLYSPRLGDTKSGDLNALLNAVRLDIERRTKRPNEDWVNDVILVYYQGEGWVDPASRRPMLHSATTLGGAAGKNLSDYAIRLDAAPRVPGMVVALANVVSADVPAADLGVDVSYLWYAWKNAGSLENLLGAIAAAMKETGRVEEMRSHVEASVRALPVRPEWFGRLADEVLARVVGLRGKL